MAGSPCHMLVMEDAELHSLGGLSAHSPSPERLRVNPVSPGLKALPRLSVPQDTQGP